MLVTGLRCAITVQPDAQTAAILCSHYLGYGASNLHRFLLPRGQSRGTHALSLSSAGVVMVGDRFSLPVRVLHWVMALGIIGILTLGFLMVYAPPADEPTKRLMFMVHKACGMVALALLGVRVVLRLLSTTPPYPEGISRTSIVLAKATHFVLYLLMLCVPVSGYIMSSAAGHPVYMVYFSIPAIVPKNESVSAFFSGVHEVAVFTLVFVVVLHILGAVKHVIFDKENVFKRII
ncbi:MAG: cytochrome b [Anaplasma ovis]